MSRRHRVRHQPRAGFTLVELMLVLILLGVLASLAVPSMATYIARKRVEGTASELLTSLRYARSLPHQTGKLIFVTFRNGANFQCYSVHSEEGAASCDCSNHPQPTCTTAAQPVQPTDFQTVIVPASTGITLTRNPDRTQYDAHTGMPDQTLTVDVSSTNGGTLRVRTNAVGRPDICTVSGHSGYPAC